MAETYRYFKFGEPQLDTVSIPVFEYDAADEPVLVDGELKVIGYKAAPVLRLMAQAPRRIYTADGGVIEQGTLGVYIHLHESCPDKAMVKQAESELANRIRREIDRRWEDRHAGQDKD